MRFAQILSGALLVLADASLGQFGNGDFGSDTFANAVSEFSAVKEQYNAWIARVATEAVLVNGGNDADAANAALDKYWHPDYIQHSPFAPSGREATRGFAIGEARLPGFFYEIGAVFAEGDYVAIHFRAGGFSDVAQIGVDFLRLDDGRFIEHWDIVMDEVPANETASGANMFPIESPPTEGGANEEANRIFVTQQLNRIYNHVDLGALDVLFAEDVVNHGPFTGAGRAAYVPLIEALTPGEVTFEIGFAAAYGDYVVVHSRLDAAPFPVTINAEIFRLEGGVVVENWDLRQEELVAQDTLSGNTMFPIY